MVDRKVLIFTEFADTARYLERQLSDAGIVGVSQIDSATKTNRAEVIKRFSPYYNGSSAENSKSSVRAKSGYSSRRTFSLKALTCRTRHELVNYDIHWNPVRLMQRIGRVDRRLNPVIEERLIADHPEAASSRGKVAFWNFLPPDDLNSLLTLYKRVTQKTLLISKTLGIEGRKLLTPEDDFDALREFNVAYEGSKSCRRRHAPRISKLW